MRIIEVTERISETNMCFVETEKAEVDELELGISMLADQEMGIGRRAVRADVYRRPTRRVDVLSQDVVLFPEAAITGTTSPND